MSQDCFLNSKDGKNCGSSHGLSGLVWLSQCNDVKNHLISCYLSKEVLSENELILARTGLFHLAKALVVQRLDNAIKRINHYPVDKC